jgi:hypothetical protein
LKDIEKIILKLSAISYAFRKLSYFLGIEVLCMIYFENFQSVIDYGVIFWGSSTRTSRIFFLLKKIIRIMMGVLPGWSCRGLFRKLDILTFPCSDVFSLTLLVLNNFNNFHTISMKIHEINTRNKNQLHRPVVNLSCYQRGVYCLGIGYLIVYHLQFLILKNSRSRFRAVLWTYLVLHSFLFD